MSKYYFTFGTDPRYPYRGGWTEVEAEDMAMAVAIFNAIHKPRTPGTVNCAFIYTSEEFESSEMYKSENSGARCHERISIRRGKELEDEQYNKRDEVGELHNNAEAKTLQADIVCADTANDGSPDSI